MVEVFKTDVKAHAHALMLIHEIHEAFAGHTANFDLQDCDHILRITSTSKMISSSHVIGFLKEYGFHAEVLTDEIPESFMFTKVI